MPVLNLSELNIVLGVLGQYDSFLGISWWWFAQILASLGVLTEFLQVASWRCTVSFLWRSSSHGTLEKHVSYADHSGLMVTDDVGV